MRGLGRNYERLQAHDCRSRRRKASSTQRIQHNYNGSRIAPASKTLNSKTIGRLLATGGIYIIATWKDSMKQRCNWVGYAPAGYDQIMGNKGLPTHCRSLSFAAGLTMGRLNPLSGVR